MVANWKSGSCMRCCDGISNAYKLGGGCLILRWNVSGLGGFESVFVLLKLCCLDSTPSLVAEIRLCCCGGGHGRSLRHGSVAFLGAGKGEKKGRLGDNRTATWMSYHIRLPYDKVR